MPQPTAQLRQTLWIVINLATWSGCPPVSAGDPPPVGSPGPGAFNAVPLFIPAPDRSAIEAEVGAVMAMTPPDRRVTAELPSGSRLSIRPGGYERGPSGSDCRRFAYEYVAIGGGRAVVTGARCTVSATASWLPLSPDTAVDVVGLEQAASAVSTPDAGAPRRQPAGAEPVRAEPVRPVQRPPMSTAAPPSRVILPFTPSR